MEWKELKITNRQDGPGHVNSSAMCLVAYEEREHIKLHSLSKIQWERVGKEIHLEGIYVFGGLKGEVPDIKIQDNNMYRLSIGG